MANDRTKMWRLLERTAADYDQKRVRLRENEQENALDAVFNPRVRLHRLDFHQTMLIKEFVAEEWRLDEDQHDPEPPNIKEEEEELWISVEEEQHNVKKEPDATMISFIAFPSKSEDDEEKPLFQLQEESGDLPTSSSTEQMKVEANELDCGATETTCNADLNINDDDSSSSETEVSEEDDDEDWISINSQQQHLSDLGTKTKDCKGSRSETSVNAVNNSFSCPECSKQFLNNFSIQRHMTCHSRVRSSGDLSDKVCFGVKKNVASSSKAETTLKYFSCDDCGERLTSKRKLNTHMRIHTGEKLFVCDVCGHIFNLKTNLERHMRIHTGQKPFGCDICGQRFSQKINLNRHATVHTGQKRFGCDVCERTFIEKGKLDVHMRIHTGEKPFGCDVCDQRFRDKGSLNTHMKIHTEQKPFACDVCGHRFRHKVNLSTHMRIHTGEKPFACGICEKRFRHKLSLNTHIKNHTGFQKVFEK